MSEYVVSQASQEWRSKEVLIRDEMPKLGKTHPGSAMRGLTFGEALEDIDNEILWYEQEIRELRKYRQALVEAPMSVTQFDRKGT